jgi:hypothetical protein
MYPMDDEAPDLTEQVRVRVPARLMIEAHKAASQTWPGIGRSGLVRVALARLAGLPEDGSELSRRAHTRRKIH